MLPDGFESALPPVLLETVGPLRLGEIGLLVTVFGAAWVVGIVARRALRARTIQFAQDRHLRVDLDLYRKTRGPVTAVCVFGLLAWAIPQMALEPAFTDGPLFVSRLGWKLALLLAVLRFVNVGADLALQRASRTGSKLNKQLVPLVRQVAILLLAVSGCLAVVDAGGVDVRALLAGLSIGGLAFALAAQDTIANFFGSVMIILDKPFRIGDLVEVGGHRGFVEEVGFRSTRLRTYHMSLVTIPNSQINAASVDNLGKRYARQVYTRLNIPLDTRPATTEVFLEGLRAILAAHPEVMSDPSVDLWEITTDGQEILLFYYIEVVEWSDESRARGETMLSFLRLAEKLGIRYVRPGRDLYVLSTPEHPAPMPPPPKDLQEAVDLARSFGPGGANSFPMGRVAELPDTPE